MDHFFGFADRKTNLKTEFLAGTTTFLTMSYIIFVNPAILADAGMDRTALIAATCLVAALASILMGLVARTPIALAPGMGLNAFFAYTLVAGYGLTWQAALGMVLVAGVIFLILSLAGIREKIVRSIPQSLITAISAGIGLFLLFIGFQKTGLVVDHPATLVTVGTLTPQTGIGLGVLFLTLLLMLRGVKGAILIGIVAGTVVAWGLGLVSLPESFLTTELNLEKIAFQFDLGAILKWSLLGPVFALLFVDMFDTLGTVVACSREAGLVRENGEIERLPQMLTVDAIATIASGLLGTSPTTSYVESATGIAEGGRTGLTAIVVGVFFLLGLLFIPLIGLVPEYVTAPALILVGLIMFRQVAQINFNQREESIPAALTISGMTFTYSISMGLAVGFLSWGLIRILQGKPGEINGVMWIVMALSAISLVV